MPDQIPITLAANWQSFLAAVIPAGAPPIQVSQTRRAFYAGMIRMFEIITGPVAEMAEVSARAQMDAMEREALAYMGEMMDAGVPGAAAHFNPDTDGPIQ